MECVALLSAADLTSDHWADRILALDRDNMTQILRESGREFPEQRRRCVLREPSLVLLALMRGEELAGYVDFCGDWRDRKDIYLSSIQLRPRYRCGMYVAKLLVATVRALRERSFRHLRGEVQKNNSAAVALFSRLGFVIRERADSHVSWEVIGDRTLLNSQYVTRLMRRMERDFTMVDDQDPR